ncbi:MAG: ABC transporter ATP-binding protein [Bacteroidetes bacterium]|nr:ABC transporter ATP-binding protein [Bacteroidota bacterium]
MNFVYQGKNGSSEFSLNNVDLKINKGEFISILGPNGSGKSTLLKIVSGIFQPARGNVLLDSIPVKSYSKKNLAKFMAYVPQTFSVAFPFSVFEIVMMGRTPYMNMFGYENLKDIDVVNSSLEKVGIYHLRNKGINEVSGGEAQRAFIARALAQNPRILLLDEPNAHLDIEHQITIFNTLDQLNSDSELTILMVSHDLNLAGFYGDRILFMKEGEIKMDDAKKNILNEDNIRTIFNVESRVEKSPGGDYFSVNIVPK